MGGYLYIAFDPGKTGGITIIGDDNRVRAVFVMPTVCVREKRKERTEYDEQHIARLLKGIIDGTYPHENLLAVIEGQQGRPGQRMGGCEESVEYAYGLLKGICVGVGIPWRKVHPTTWTNLIYEGITERCPGCGRAIDENNRVIRERQVVRQKGKHKGKKVWEQGRFCPACKHTIDGKQRSIDYCRKEYPKIDLREDENHRVAHTGIADSLCIGSWAVRTQLR